jgi:hypothetical protein
MVSKEFLEFPQLEYCLKLRGSAVGWSHYATSWSVAFSIPDDIVEFVFQLT